MEPQETVTLVLWFQNQVRELWHAAFCFGSSSVPRMLASVSAVSACLSLLRCTYLTSSIISFLCRAEVSTNFDRISNNKIPGLLAKSKHTFFSGTIKETEERDFKMSSEQAIY